MFPCLKSGVAESVAAASLSTAAGYVYFPYREKPADNSGFKCFTASESLILHQYLKTFKNIQIGFSWRHYN